MSSTRDLRHLTWHTFNQSAVGSFPMAIEHQGNTKYYYKLSSCDSFGNIVGTESALEIVAYRLGKFFGFPVLPYKGIAADVIYADKPQVAFVAYSKDFCKSAASMSFVSYWKLMNRPFPIAEFAKSINAEYANKLLIFDFLTMQFDRHGANIELLNRDNNTFFAPIFDNGNCLTSRCGNNTNLLKYFDANSNNITNNFICAYWNLSIKYMHAITLPRLSDKVLDSLFIGLHRWLSTENIEVIKRVLTTRYAILQQAGVIL